MESISVTMVTSGKLCLFIDIQSLVVAQLVKMVQLSLEQHILVVTELTRTDSLRGVKMLLTNDFPTCLFNNLEKCAEASTKSYIITAFIMAKPK